MSHTLDFDQIINAINSYWLTLKADLDNSTDCYSKAKIALSIYVWRCKNEHRIKFFTTFASGNPSSKTTIFETLNTLENHQSECELSISNLNDHDQYRIYTWIKNYLSQCLKLSDWEPRIDGLDNCTRLIDRYKQLLPDKLNEQFNDLVIDIKNADNEITNIIKLNLEPVISGKFDSKSAGLAFFEQQCEKLPTKNLTLILERLIGTNIPIGLSLNSSNPFNSIHESIPYNSLKSILTSPHFNPKETFLDLGSGSGTLAIALSLFSDVTISGVEIVPELAQISIRASKKLHLNINFTNQDALDSKFSGFQNIIIFSTVTGMTLENLINKFLNTHSINKIWTIGFISSKFNALGWSLLTSETSDELGLHIFKCT